MREARTLAFTAATAALAVTTALVSPAVAHPHHGHPGAPGAGDPYYPLDGNGGYDVRHYDLAIGYDPDTDLLVGRATIQARSTQNLSRFNLDLVGMDVKRIRVDGARARWSRAGQELRVTPRRALHKGERFTVRVIYSGVPQLIEEPFTVGGFIPTDDGFDILGEPHVAASWFPVNDHPTDKASYTFHVTVPRSREVVANGRLVSRKTRGGWSTWTYDSPSPMASYLATVDVGEWNFTRYRDSGLRYLDAIDPDLYTPFAAPSTGAHFAVSQSADLTYKRLARTIAVPAGSATAGFTITRDTETDWDFVFVEAHTVGQDDWTTLPDVNGHTTQGTGNSCLLWPDMHPFISSHYMTVDQTAETCTPSGATGEWWAATGESDGPEQWQVDLSAYAGGSVELSISYVSDDVVQHRGVFVDDIVVSTGEGSTSFESGLDGWTVPGAPAGSAPNSNDWIVGTAADVPPSTGEIAEASLDRQPEIVAFLSSYLGRYPWRDIGGIVDDTEGLPGALETQTRPIYALDFFTDSISGDSVVVHELAHQWNGDSLAVQRWRDIWLNEGFATYAEWLWSEREGLGTTQEIFDFFYNDFIPPDDPWWDVIIGDPGPDLILEFPVYFRGAMTLQVLRDTVGDGDFFRILRVWAQSRAGDNVSIRQFIRLAERISGQQLDDLFDTWLFSAGRPVLETPTPASGRSASIPPGARATLAIAEKEGLLDR
jgi:hypothetical protein